MLCFCFYFAMCNAIHQRKPVSMTKCLDIKQQETQCHNKWPFLNYSLQAFMCTSLLKFHLPWGASGCHVFVTIQDQLQMCPYCETHHHWTGRIYQLLLNYSRIHVYLGFIPRPFSVVGNYCFVPHCRCSTSSLFHCCVYLLVVCCFLFVVSMLPFYTSSIVGG